MDVKSMSVAELEREVGQKNVSAMVELGHRYRTGSGGVERNLTKAYQMYHKAEKRESKEAYLAIGEMYLYGEGLARNEDLARNYYMMAGVSMPQGGAKPTSGGYINESAPKYPGGNKGPVINDPGDDEGTYDPHNPSTVKSYEKKKQETYVDVQTPPHDVNIIEPVAKQPVYDTGDIASIRTMINQAESERNASHYDKAKQLANQAIVNLGSMNTPDEQELLAEAYWVLGYTAFNEQDHGTMLAMMERPGVLEYHPWGSYLIGQVHRMKGAGNDVLLNDMQRMLNSLNNKRLTKDQLGDIFSLLGDFALAGITNTPNEKIEQAYGFFRTAAEDYGNNFAADQLTHFTKTLKGKYKYK